MGHDVQIYSKQQKNTLADVQAAISWRERTSYHPPNKRAIKNPHAAD